MLCLGSVQRQSSQLSRTSEMPLTELERPMLQSNTTTSSDEHTRKQSFTIIQKIFNSKYHLFSIILLTITIASVIICFTLFHFLLIRTPPSSIQRSKNIQSDKMILIFEFDLFLELVYIIKEGLQYGNKNFTQNESFNDAKDLKLSYTDQCIGVELQWTSNSLISVRFLYSNNHSSSLSIVQGQALPVLPPRFFSTFMLISNEEINKINLHQTNSNIIGIQFQTTTGRKSNVFGSKDGYYLIESFEDYTFGYAKGRQQDNKGVDILQFIWIKQIPSNHQIDSGVILYLIRYF